VYLANITYLLDIEGGSIIVCVLGAADARMFGDRNGHQMAANAPPSGEKGGGEFSIIIK
jgi:hypothetical protein